MEISRPRIESNPLSDTRSRFIIEPLEPGFGYTLGNSLRRTLLSSIPGAAVTSIKIDGVLHEFSSIQGVKEDVTDRSEEHTSELQSRNISYAVFCLKKKQRHQLH